MLAFIDESGHPHPSDDSTRPVIVAVCINREDSKLISSHLYGLKRRLGVPQIELKGVNLINRRVFHRRGNEWELVESFFDPCRTLPFVVFAVVMERPLNIPWGSGSEPESESYLPNQFRYLLQRVNQIAQERGRVGVLLFDGEGPTLYHGLLPHKFESFLYGSNEGRSFAGIAEAPFFVDSRITQGIQIADMISSIVRQYQGNRLYETVPAGDGFLSAVSRYYMIIREKTRDLISPEGFQRPGLYFMPERDHYQRRPDLEV